VVDIRLNFTRMNEGHNLPSVGFNPTSLGFPASIALTRPTCNARDFFNKRTSLQALGASGANKLPSHRSGLPNLDDNRATTPEAGRISGSTV